jgi:hypothetical protein
MYFSEFWQENLKKREHKKDLDVDRKIFLKRILKK